jgi:5-methyltetrahydrofolate--homocysteine methyltransferase
MRRDLLEAIADRVLVCEGAMGSMLTSRGVSVRNSAEANLTHPETVAAVHRAYQAAGAVVFQTNTFAANPHMLARVGLLPQASDIWSAAVRLCREAAGPNAYVAANGGPTGSLLEPLGDLSADEARAAFRRQFEVLLSPLVDFVLLESFESLEEAELAVAAVRELDGAIPVAVTVTFSTPTGRTSMGVDGTAVARRLGACNVQMLGANCGTPEALELGFGELSAATDRPLMAKPNAGVPALIQGETVFDGTPAAMGEQAARLIARGARLVGGCCGSTPAHIAQVARAASART